MPYGPYRPAPPPLPDEEIGVGRADPDSWLAYPEGMALKSGQIVVASTTHPVLVTRSDGTLSEFLALEAAPDEDLLAYARRWGSLESCGHGLRRGHGLVWVRDSLLGGGQVEARPTCPRAVGDDVALWRYWVRQAVALSRVVSDVRRRRPSTDDALAVLGESAPWVLALVGFDTSDPPARLQRLRALPDPREASVRAAQGALNGWLELARTGPSVRWVSGRPTIWLATDCLLGALGLGLLDRAAGRTEVRCAGCGNGHYPARPNGALRNGSFCARCRSDGTARRAARDAYRARKSLDPDWLAAEAARARGNRAKAKVIAGASGAEGTDS